MNLQNKCHLDLQKNQNIYEDEFEEDYFEKLLDMDTSSPEIGNNKDGINPWSKIVNLTNTKPQTALEKLKIKNKNFKGQISVKRESNLCKKLKTDTRIRKQLYLNKVKVVSKKNPPLGILQKITTYSTTQKNTVYSSSVWPLTNQVKPIGNHSNPLNLFCRINNITNTFPKINQEHSLEMKKSNEEKAFFPSKIIKPKQSLPNNKNNQNCLLKKAMILFKKNNYKNQKENKNPQNNSTFNFQIQTNLFSKERFDRIGCKEKSIETEDDDFKFDKLFKKYLNQMIAKRI